MTRKHKLDNQKPISDVSKEPSGAQKRKKQKEIEDKDKKLRKQAERFLKVTYTASFGYLSGKL